MEKLPATDPHVREGYPMGLASGKQKSQPKVEMFKDDLGACKNRTNSGEGSSSKPSL